MQNGSENIPERVVVCRLGIREYLPLWDLQRELQTKLALSKRSEPRVSIPHILLLVEHPPVYTLGKSGNKANFLIQEGDLAAQGATFVHVDRGGDITYHGPGQLVGYPILDLDRFYTDIHRYLRELEEVIIRTCASYQLSAGRLDNLTGVWLGCDEQGQERKIGAMGVRCSHWVTMHGFAFNINTDLNRYDAIVPCGISDRSITSIATELGQHIDETAVQDTLIDQFQDVFDVDIDVHEGSAADSFLEAYLADEPVLK